MNNIVSEDDMASLRQQDSLCNVLWKLGCNAEYSYVRCVAQRYHFSEVVASIICSRVDSIHGVDDFLFPTVKALLPDPYSLLDISEAVIRICAAFERNEVVAIFADYDVDGATSAAVLKKYLDYIGISNFVYIPDRFSEGYGPNVAALEKIKADGATLCIMLDCGTGSCDILNKSKGLDIIVVDHHISTSNIPDVVSVINPNRLDEDFVYKNLAAVGVTFMLLVALNSKFEKKFNLIELLDLVALGTVCDVVSLTGLNRAFVKTGIRIAKKRTNIGLGELCDIAKIDSPLKAYHFGYLIGPRINAGSRVGDSELGARILSTNDSDKAKDIAKLLNDFNNERKILEKIVLDEAFAQVEEDIEDFVLVSGAWHKGVIGIVASRLKEKFYVPSIVIGVSNSVGVASCRSISGVDIGSIILEAKLSGIIKEGGGHAMAAGFTLDMSKLNILKSFLKEKLLIIFDKIGRERIRRADALIDSSMISVPLLKQLEKLEPYGAGNNEPIFIIKNVTILFVKISGEHLFCTAHGNKKFKLVLFNGVSTKLGDFLLSSVNTAITIIARLSLEYWNGRENISAYILDILD